MGFLQASGLRYRFPPAASSTRSWPQFAPQTAPWPRAPIP